MTKTRSLIALSCANQVRGRLDLSHRQEVSRRYSPSVHTVVYLARHWRIPGRFRTRSMPETNTEAWKRLAFFVEGRFSDSEVRSSQVPCAMLKVACREGSHGKTAVSEEFQLPARAE